MEDSLKSFFYLICSFNIDYATINDRLKQLIIEMEKEDVEYEKNIKDSSKIRIEDKSYLNSEANQYLSRMRLYEIKELMKILKDRIEIQPGRNEKRNKELMIKWAFENWDIIYPHLSSIKMYDMNNNEITINPAV